jgi:hypothetical protein
MTRNFWDTLYTEQYMLICMHASQPVKSVSTQFGVEVCIKRFRRNYSVVHIYLPWNRNGTVMEVLINDGIAVHYNIAHRIPNGAPCSLICLFAVCLYS